jgi:hypothetical protein
MTAKRRKRHGPEQTVRKLDDADAMLNAGKDVAAVLQAPEVSEATYLRWRNQYSGMKAEVVSPSCVGHAAASLVVFDCRQSTLRRNERDPPLHWAHPFNEFIPDFIRLTFLAEAKQFHNPDKFKVNRIAIAVLVSVFCGAPTSLRFRKRGLRIGCRKRDNPFFTEASYPR